MQKETSTFRECRRENDQITNSEILWAGFFSTCPPSRWKWIHQSNCFSQSLAITQTNMSIMQKIDENSCWGPSSTQFQCVGSASSIPLYIQCLSLSGLASTCDLPRFCWILKEFDSNGRLGMFWSPNTYHLSIILPTSAGFMLKKEEVQSAHHASCFLYVNINSIISFSKVNINSI